MSADRLQTAAELRGAAERYLADVVLTPELGGLEEPMRYALDSGGKRVRPVVCLGTTQAAGGSVEEALPAAAAIELVHTFSLVHDDLPALDDDDERRGRPSLHAAFGEGVALLAGDALRAEARQLALTYPEAGVARELAQATLGMIGGQYRDVTGARGDSAALYRLKTGRLFAASVGLGLRCAGTPDREQAPWRAFAEELGLLYQVVDDVLDGDGMVLELGVEEARRVADEVVGRARTRLADIPADTSVLEELVADLAARSSSAA
jgi:geranylgeranyl diphosphate synthase type II